MNQPATPATPASSAIFDATAEGYALTMAPSLRPVAGEVVRRAALQTGERVLDVGCGTGIVARRAAARMGAGGRIAGLDLNEGMLAVARAASATVRPAIEWRQGNAAELPFPEASFDVAVSQQMLQFVSDTSAVLREMRRVLAPEGRVALLVCRPIAHSPDYVALAGLLGRHVGPEAEAGMRSPFPAWTVEDVRGLVAEAGLRDAWVRIDAGGVRYPSAREFLRREAASSPLAGPIAALAPDKRDALIHELEIALESRRDDEGIVLPLEAYVVVAGG